MTLTVRALGLVLVVFGVVATPVAQPRPDAAKLKQQFIGSYKLISYVQYDQNGVERRTNHTAGQISYDAAGRMSAQLMPGDRPPATSRTSGGTKSTPNAASLLMLSRARSARPCWGRRCLAISSFLLTARRCTCRPRPAIGSPDVSGGTDINSVSSGIDVSGAQAVLPC